MNFHYHFKLKVLLVEGNSPEKEASITCLLHERILTVVQLQSLSKLTVTCITNMGLI